MNVGFDDTVINLDDLGKRNLINKNKKQLIRIIFIDIFPIKMESSLSDDPNDEFNRFSAIFDEKVRNI